MNKTIKGLLVTALALSAQSAHAYTNKTFLQPRNQGLVNLPLEMTTFQERISVPTGKRCGGHLEAALFGGANTNKHEIGKYFGINNKSEITLTQGMNPLQLRTDNGTFDVGYMIHDSEYARNTYANEKLGSISFIPQSTHVGVDFVYYQDLSKIVNGFYLKVNVPVESVSNDLKLKVKGGSIAEAVATIGTGLATKANIYNFFKGHAIVDQDDSDKQERLSAGKIHGKRTATGVSDIDVMLGYNFIKEEASHAGFNIGFSIPTGKKSTGEWLFEPVYGTPNFGFGAGFEGCKRIWGDTNHNLKINAAVNFRYLFQGTEHRMPGIGEDNFGLYELIAYKNDDDDTSISLTPAANLLNEKVHVTPGCQFDGIIGFAYNKGGFNMDLGYNIYFKEREDVKAIKTHYLGHYEYGTASKGLVVAGDDMGDAKQVGTQAAFESVTHILGESKLQFDNVRDTDIPWLSRHDVAMGAAQTPSQFTNSIYAGLGYAFRKWEYPMMLGCGGKYEFAAKNSALEIWQIDAKIGLSF